MCMCVFIALRLTTSSSVPSEIIDARMPEEGESRAEGICFDFGAPSTHRLCKFGVRSGSRGLKQTGPESNAND